MAKSRTVNSNMRDEIFRAACSMRERQLSKEQGSLQQLERKLIAESADAIYDALVPKKEQRMLRRLPAHFVPQTTRLYVDIPDDETNGRGYGRRMEVTFSGQRPLPFSLHIKSPTLPRDHEVVKQIHANERKYREIQKAYTQFQDECRALLSGVRTLRQLLQRWPEVVKIEGINPELFVEQQSTALVITADTVNSLLGLNK